MESFSDLVENFPPTKRDLLEKEMFLVDVDLSALLQMGEFPPETALSNREQQRISEILPLSRIPIGIKIRTKCGAIVMLGNNNQFTQIL